MNRIARAAFTLVEIMIVVGILALLAAIAIPNVLRGRTNANESAAISNLRILLSALEMYRSVNNIYPDTTTWQTAMYGADCAPGTQPVPDFGPQSFCIGMTGQVVQGYLWTYAGAAAPATTFTILAVPGTPGITGTRSFYTDQTTVLRHCTGTGTAAGMVDDARIDEPVLGC